MKPLFAQTVLLTRPVSQQEPLRTLLQDAGAEVLSQPAIEIRPPKSWERVDDVLHRLDSFDWIVFASANGVPFFLDRCRTARFPKICAVGPGTAAELENRGKRVGRIPQPHTAEGVVAALAPEAEAGQRILLVRASRGRDFMYKKLSAIHPDENGVEEIVAYESVDVDKPEPQIVSLMESGRIDWTTCTSSAIAASLVRMFGECLRKTKLVSISPITTETIRRFGFENIVESRNATMPGIFETIIQLKNSC
ncbi:MAG: uroporphyrinogen-III synthase [Planctomycetaceae bacterium]|nr:uroporphyrinogen-III synthase [Planctomycetaceae bacterium]